MRLLLLLLALLPASALAQPAAYFPLNESAQWTYGTLSSPPDAPPDTFWTPPVHVRGTATVRDTVYTLVSFPSMLSDSLRADDAGRIWGRRGGRDDLLLDVTLADGETYEVWDDGLGESYTVTVSRGRSITTHAGQFETCIEFLFDVPEFVDEERYVALAPGVGIVRIGGGWSSYDLMHATLDGTIILNGDNGPEPAALQAFPNPFASSLTVELPQGAWTRVELVDALGRTVATLREGPCAASSCRLTWDASGAAPGVYVVLATGPSGTARQRVVRAR